MSKIAEQIKQLQIKQKKIDYVSYIADLIKGDTKCVDFADVKEEIVAKIEPFLIDLMTAIENDSEVKARQTETLSEEDKKVLKVLADKAKGKINSTENQTPTQSPYSNGQPPPPAEPKKPLVSNQDKMSFAIQHRHLGGKQVQVLSDQNVNVTGKVVGIDAPWIIVKTDQGPTISVPVEKVVVQ